MSSALRMAKLYISFEKAYWSSLRTDYPSCLKFRMPTKLLSWKKNITSLCHWDIFLCILDHFVQDCSISSAIATWIRHCSLSPSHRCIYLQTHVVVYPIYIWVQFDSLKRLYLFIFVYDKSNFKPRECKTRNWLKDLKWKTIGNVS